MTTYINYYDLLKNKTIFEQDNNDNKQKSKSCERLWSNYTLSHTQHHLDTTRSLVTGRPNKHIIICYYLKLTSLGLEMTRNLLQWIAMTDKSLVYIVMNL